MGSIDQEFAAVAEIAQSKELHEKGFVNMTDGQLLVADPETLNASELARLQEIVGDPEYAA